jgi:hypothetical protein
MPPRTKQGLKSGETPVCGDQWPIFLYAGCIYDPEDPWKGLLRSDMLIFISSVYLTFSLIAVSFVGFQTCIHVTKLSG